MDRHKPRSYGGAVSVRIGELLTAWELPIATLVAFGWLNEHALIDRRPDLDA